MTTDEHRFALELSDFPRTYRAIAAALLDAAALDGVDHVDRAGALTRGLVDRYMVIDQLAIADVFMAVVGYLAQRTGRTPRQIHEEFFEQAPPDEWWRRKIEGSS